MLRWRVAVSAQLWRRSVVRAGLALLRKIDFVDSSAQPHWLVPHDS